jgi:hypothetical protein
MTKEIIIVSLIVLVVYLYYQQNNQSALIQPNSQELQDLQQQVQHYQTLYQKRVAKDLETDQSAQIQQLTLTNQQLENNLSGARENNNLFQQKVGDLETQLINLAKQKIKGKKEAQALVKQLEIN